MEKCLDTSTYFDKLIITSEAFNNVSYEIRGRNIQLMVWLNGSKKPVTIPMTFKDCLTLCIELQDVIKVYDI